jgi:inosine-uridine nucleoside N-ribohydrolase
MTRRSRLPALGALVGALIAAVPQASGPGTAAQAPAQPRIKVIADQDSAGPAGTNLLSLLMLLMAEDVELAGITTVSGDQWVEQSTIFALWATELTGRTGVPVVKGAEQPLLRTGRETELLERLYGSHPSWHGTFNSDTPPSSTTWPPPGGMPAVGARPGRAADFIIDTVRAHPGEVVIYAAGPLTNLALAVRMDPGIVTLTRALHVMGASSDGAFELNWWWDPEAAAIVMREPWKQIVVTTGEVGFEVQSSAALMERAALSGGRLARHLRSVYFDTHAPAGTTTWSAMWDELAVAALLDPGVITRAETMYLDVVTDRGPKYGHTVVWRPPAETLTFFLPYSGPGGPDQSRWREHRTPPAHVQPATVHMTADVARFEELFIRVMGRK